MADAPILDPRTDAFSQLLLEQPDDAARKRVWKQAQQLTLAQLPTEEVGKAPVRTLEAYLAHEIQLPPMVVHSGMVARGGVHAMIAKGGKGKTTLSLNRLIRWGMGRPLVDELPTVLYPDAPLKVLLIENEGSPGSFQRNLRTILTKNDFTDEERATAAQNVHIWGEGGWSGLKLDDPESFAMLRRACEDVRPDIVFLEPMRGLWRGNENDASEMANMIDTLSELANTYELGVMLTHHERKSGTGEGDGGDPMDAARGSTVLTDLCAVVERWKPAKRASLRELTWAKSRFEEAPAPMRFKFVRATWSYQYVTEKAITRELATIISQMPEYYFTMKELMDETGEARYNIDPALKSLVNDKLVLKRAYGEGGHRYRWAEGASDDESDTLPLT